MGGIWNDFTTLWTGMEILPAVFLSLGLVLVIIEMFNPGFGIFGALGGVLLVLGVVVRVMQSDPESKLAHLFMLTFIILLLLTIVFLIIVRLMKFGWISQSSLVNNEVTTSLSETADFSYLVGHVGVSLTSLHPTGKAFINGNNYDVVTRGDFIESNVEVRVREVEGVRIVVERN